MSNTFFPALVSSNWKLTRTPQWATTPKASVCGDIRRAALRAKPFWKWTLKNGVLQSAPSIGDLQAIEDLFNAMAGRLDFFLWRDPEGESIVDPSVQINILGTYYWPVAFLSDSVSFDRFAYQLWQCGTLAFEQVGLSAFALANLQQPHGAITAATLHVTWAYSPGGGGPEVIIKHGAAIPSIFSGSWATRTDSLPISVLAGFGLSGWSSYIGFQSSSNGGIDPPFLLSVYEIYADATYEDGFIDTLRPSMRAVQGNDSDYGTVLNPGNAADNNLATAATITGSKVFPLRSNGQLVFTF